MQQKPNIVKLINLAMCFSIVTCGAVLVILRKMAFIALPSTDLTQLQMLSLAANAIVAFTVFYYRSTISLMTDPARKLPLSIVMLAMNEFCAIMGYIAVFMSESGNGYFFVMNAVSAIVGNLLMFPRD